jgi:hypothetical protein
VVRSYRNPGPVAFSAEIVRNGDVANSSAFVEFPHDLKETFGAGNLVPVAVVFDGAVPYSGRLTKMGDRALLFVRKDVRHRLGKEPGEVVDVVVALDERPREVEVAEDLAAALDAAGVRHRFDALAYSHRKEYVRWVEEAKRPETRQRRIESTCEMVAAGRTRN